MKTVYIPKGETVHYESLTTEHLVVHGRLHVTYGIKAQSITGSGVIDAGSINADTVCIDDVESGTVICKRLIAKRVQAPEVFASESAAVSCFLSAAYVETGKLTAAISEVDEVVAQEVVNLTPKKRTLFGTLFASMLRSFWTALTAPGQKAEVLDAEFVPAQEDHTETVQNEGSAEFSASDQSVPEVEEKQEDVVDEELNRIVGLFKLSREQGYIGIYRLYLPNKQADVLYSSIPRNALRLRLEPPPSNVEAVWDNGDVLFFARYEELLNTSSGYAPETMGEDECIGMLELDEKLYSAQAHYAAFFLSAG